MGEQDVVRELHNQENCHVVSYRQISSTNSFADSQLQQQSVGKNFMLIDELPDLGSISASAYKNWVSQNSSVNANVKDHQRLTKGTISMGVMYFGNKTLEYTRDGVGPTVAWPDTGCLRRISAESAARNKKLDPSPYKFMKNITPAELIAEKEVCVLWLCIGNGFYIAREIDRIIFWSYVRHLKAYDLMTIHASILWDDYPPFKSFERVFPVFY